MHCANWKCIGFDVDGGHAEKLRILAINCMKMPKEMSFAFGALSTDKVGTLYHAQKRLSVSGRDSIVVFGMGPMGLVWVTIAVVLAANVIAVDVVEERLRIAKEVSSHHILNAKDIDVVKEIRNICGGEGADVGIDCTGKEEAQACGVSAVHR